MFEILTCVGVDNIRHHYKPNESKCLCGEKIKKRINNLTPKIADKYRFSCGVCDYMVDDIESKQAD
jgi:hypothetical protein|tara:strand:- start:15350 stop:15547 length:198 start_codon:yes stop_codon:yes gene_type:complete